MKNLQVILEKLVIQKKLSHTSGFRKHALAALGERNPYDLFKKLYKNMDVECGKMLVQIFPSLFYDGEFRKDTKADKQAKKEGDIKYLNKSFFSFMKATGVLDKDEELNHILCRNKVISKNGRLTPSNSFILPFANMSLDFNIHFSLMCAEVTGYTLPPLYNRMALSSLAFNSEKTRDLLFDKILKVFLKQNDIFNNPDKKIQSNMDNIRFILSKSYIYESSKPMIKELFLQNESEILNLYINEASTISTSDLEEKMLTIENLLSCGICKEKVFNIVKIINISQETNMSDFKELIKLGFDINDKMLNIRDGRYHFWFEKIINNVCEDYTDSMEIMKYAVKNGLDILSPLEDLNGMNRIDYVMNTSINVFYAKKNKKEIEELIYEARMNIVEKEKALIAKNIKEISVQGVSIKKRI